MNRRSGGLRCHLETMCGLTGTPVDHETDAGASRYVRQLKVSSGHTLIPCSPFTEVERARKLLEQTCVGRTIQEVTVREDTIVFVGGQGAHETFKADVQGRKVDAAARKGKV